MDLLKKINGLRKSQDGLSPVALGWSIIKGVTVPVSAIVLPMGALSAILLLYGVDTTDIFLQLIIDMSEALNPILAKLFGGWTLYSYIYLLIAPIAVDIVRNPYPNSLRWLWVRQTLPRTVYWILDALERIRCLTTRPITDYLRLVLSRVPVYYSSHPHLAIGWQPNIHPQIE